MTLPNSGTRTRCAMRLEPVDGLGDALVADEPGYTAGETVLTEEPLLISPALSDLQSAEEASWCKQLAQTLAADITWVLHSLAFAQSSVEVQHAVLHRFCTWADGADAVALELSGGVQAEAKRLVTPIAYHLQLDPTSLYTALGVLCLNAHNVGHGRAALYTTASKFAHVRVMHYRMSR